MTTRYIHIVVLCLLYSVISWGQPIITGFNPFSGPVGTTITITGSGFDAIPSNNVVYFGTARANVISASTTSLEVTVPTGITDPLFSVTTAALTAQSAFPFMVTYPGGGGPFNAGSFALKVDIPVTGSPYDVAAGDLNGDNKPELIVPRFGASSISVFTNACTPTSISFPAQLNLTTGSLPKLVGIRDLDGDGLADIVAGSIGGTPYISVFRNTSTGGSISFAPKIDYPGSSSLDGLFIFDVDGDGKPEIAASIGQYISILKNNSTQGNILFNAPLLIPMGPDGVSDIQVRDVNGNGKPDIISCSNTSLKLIVVNNSSSNGIISFDTPITYTTLSRPIRVSVGDLDDDGKPDVALSFESAKIGIYQNIGSGNTIDFIAGPLLNVGHSVFDVEIADLNGDGKTDISCSNLDVSSTVTLFKNVSAGTPAFDTGIDLSIGSGNRALMIADLTGDGKPDIATATGSNNIISVRRNKAGELPLLTSFLPAAAGEGGVITIKGKNLAGLTAVGFGGVAAAEINVVNDSTVTARVATGATGIIEVTTWAGTAQIGGFTFSPRPSISSFSPLSGVIGQRVKIIGANFSATPSENIVFFGAARAIVNSASVTELNVTVPPGATYEPISVTRNNITSWSQKPFDVTFANGAIINDSTFVYTKSFDTGLDGMRNMTLADIDGDGKDDIVTQDLSSEKMVVLRNTTTNGVLSFTQHLFASSTNAQLYDVTVGDIDGDGKIDVVVPCNFASSVRVYRNTSTPGTISFTSQTFTTGSSPDHVALGDIDGDGKADMVVSNEGASSSLSVFRNTSSASGIAFTALPSLATFSAFNWWVEIADIDGDGKNDVISVDAMQNLFSIFRNAGSIGTISFDPRQDFIEDHPVSYVTVLDLDNDNKKDVVLSLAGPDNDTDSLLHIYKNISTPGNIAFAEKKKYYEQHPHIVKPHDIDGDGKPDLGFVRLLTEIANDDFDDGELIFLCNASTADSLSFVHKRIADLNPITTIIDPQGMTSGDIDGDNRPDVMVIDETWRTINFFINYAGSNKEFCPGGNDSISADQTGVMYRWQIQKPDSTYRYLANDANYSGVNTSLLRLNNIPSSWAGYKYRCLVNPTFSTLVYTKEYTIRMVNRWTGAINSSWENPGNWSCGTVPDNNTDVIINSGTIILNSNTTIRTLRLDPDVSLTVNPGYLLTVTN